MRGVTKISPGTYLLRDAMASVTFGGGTAIDTVAGGLNVAKGGVKIAPWGADNLLPQQLFKLVWENHLKPQLITTARDFLIGSRIGVFRRVVADEKERFIPVSVPEIEDWLEEMEADKYMRRAAYNLEFFANVFTAISLDRTLRVSALQCFDGTDVRAAVIDPSAGRIETYIIHPDWRKFKAGEGAVLPAFDRRNPVRHGQSMLHGRDETPGQSYYDLPAWYGTRKWTDISNEIPKFHGSGLKNGYNIKYHIQIPADYFAQYGTEDEQEKAEQELLDSMNSFLSGVDNVNKAFVSKYATDAATGREMPGWKIEPIEDKMNTEAYIALDQQANTAHASGHGIDPSLAGIDQNSKLGGSGSEKRISYQLHIALRTQNKRKILLEPFNTAAKKIMGWDRDIFIGFVDTDVTTLADDKSGTRPATNQAQ